MLIKTRKYRQMMERKGKKSSETYCWRSWENMNIGWMSDKIKAFFHFLHMIMV